MHHSSRLRGRTRSLYCVAILILSSAVAATAGTPASQKLRAISGVNPAAPLYSQDEVRAIQPDVTHLGRLDPIPTVVGASVESHALPDFVCFDQDNNCYCALGIIDYFEDGADVGVKVLGMGVLYDVTETGNGYICSLDGVWNYIIDGAGDIDIKYEVWTSVGGIPGALVATELRNLTVMNNRATGPTGWNWIDFSSHGLYFTSDFIVSVSPVPGSGSNPGVDFFSQYIDNTDGSATTPRTAATHWGDLAAWLTNDNRWSFNYSPILSAVGCCEELPFTDCYFDSDFDLDCYAYVFSLPNTTNCRQGLAERFRSGGFDTLTTARFGITDFGYTPEAGAAFLVEVLGDNGMGAPDPTNVLFSTTIGGVGSEMDLLPFGTGAFQYVDVPIGIVVPPSTDYHLAIRWAGPTPHNSSAQLYIGADDFNNDCNSSMGSSVFFPGTYGTTDPGCIPMLDGWYSYTSAFGYNPDFWIEAEVCLDEFYSCELSKSHADISFIVPWGDGEGALGFASRYLGGDECRIEAFTVGMHAWENLDSINFCIFADANGEPGAVLYSESLGRDSIPLPTNFDTYCGPNSPSGNTWLHTVYPNDGSGFTVVGVYWIGAMVYTDASGDPCSSYFWNLISSESVWDQDARSGLILDPAIWGGDSYRSLVDVYGGYYNHITEVYACCVPFKECGRCGMLSGWATYQGDYARTGRSFESLGNANCNLTVDWSANSDVGNSFSGSVIFEDKVIISDDGGYDCRDLNTGALLWDQNTNPIVSDLFSGTLGNKTQPTVADIGGVKMAFLGTAFKRDMVAVSVNTGAYIWHATGGGAPFPGLHKKVDNAKSIVWNDGMIDVLFYSGESFVYAVEAATGMPYTGWTTNPLDLSAAGDNLNALTSDGTQLFVPTYSGSVPGNLFAIDMASGMINWDLATVVGYTGLEAEAQSLPGYANQEGFWGGCSYDENFNVIWANSYLNADHPAEGHLYRINADGSGYSARPSTRSRRSTPTIDYNAIYVPVFTRWLGPAYDGFGVYDRASGDFITGLDGKIPGDRQYNDGVLSCESGMDDWWILGTELGQLNFFQMGNLNQWSFSRISTLSGGGGGQWAGGSMVTDRLVFTNFGGQTVAFGPGPDRPRLDVLSQSTAVSVPFGTPIGEIFTFPEIFSNLGCAELIIDSITLDDAPAPVAYSTEIDFTSVAPQLLAKMNEYASRTSNAAQFEKIALMLGERDDGIRDLSTVTTASSTTLNYRAATAFPAVVDGASGQNGIAMPLFGSMLTPGDSMSIAVHANGPAVTRGPHAFYASLHTNDPDYYVDDVTRPAEVQLVFIGGCIEDSTMLHFGIGGANFTVVWNTANIAYFTSNGDHSVNINGYEAGGPQGEPFGALRGWNVTGHRMAMTGQSWDGPGDNYFSILGDPNYCSNECKPTLDTDALLGEISTDMGATYTQVFGEVSAVTYIDSVRDYGAGGGWNTTSLPLSFNSDSTMGFIANETHYGAWDVAELADFKLVRVDVTNRSGSDSINHLVHWAHHDYDLAPSGSENTMQGRPDKGYVYATSPGAVVADGYVKVPFGCGAGSDFNYIINGFACDQDISWWDFDAVEHYLAMNEVGQGNLGLNTIVYQTNMNTFAGEDGAPSDASGDWYFGSMDLGPSETKSFGFAQFAFLNLTDADDDDQFIGFADMVNKWAGWGRGDVNNDLTVDLADIIYLSGSVAGGNGPYPFYHLGDLDFDDAITVADVEMLVAFYFGCGPCPEGRWTLGVCQ